MKTRMGLHSFFALLILLFAFETRADSPPRMVGYFTNWSQYRQGTCKFTPENIHPEYFTHINYAFAKIGTNDQVQPVEWNDLSSDGVAGLYDRVNRLKIQSPQLKTLISIGGWTLSNAFPPMAASPERRANFIRSAIQYARSNNFDGIDLDWEYPGFAEHGGTPQDKQNFTALLHEFRQAINNEIVPANKDKLLLTIAAAAGESNFNNYELSQIHYDLDWINLMTYDFHGSWDSRTGVNSPLLHDSTPGGNFNMDYTVSAYLRAGVPASKLVLGMPTYGRTFGSVSGTTPNSPVTSQWNPNPPRGRCTQEAGFMAYYEIQELLNNQQYQLAWDNNTETPYAYDGQGNWISFDNAESIDLKVNYLKDQSLSGAMVWAMDLDDFNQGYPLISRMSSALGIQQNPAPQDPSTGSGQAPSPAPTPTPTPELTPIAPSPDPTILPTPSPDPSGSMYSGSVTTADGSFPEGLSVQITEISNWGSGAQYSVQITNASAQTSYSNIKLLLNVPPHAISSLWDMQMSNATNAVELTLPSWKPSLDMNTNYNFGFVLSQAITPSISFGGATVQSTEAAPAVNPSPTPVSSPTPTPSPATPSEGALTQILSPDVTLNLVADSEWGAGTSWSGATYRAILTNTNPANTLTQIRIRADVGSSTSFWGMQTVSSTGDETVMDLPSYQNGLKPNESYTFGFTIAPLYKPQFTLVASGSNSPSASTTPTNTSTGSDPSNNNSSSTESENTTSVFIPPPYQVPSLHLDSTGSEAYQTHQLMTLMDQSTYYDPDYFLKLGLAAERACSVRIPEALALMKTQMLIGRPIQGQSVNISYTPDVTIRLPDKYFAMFLAYAQDQYGLNPHLLMSLGAKETFFGAISTSNDNSYFIVDQPNDYFQGSSQTPLDLRGYFTDGNGDGPFQVETPSFSTLISAFPERLDIFSACNSFSSEACSFLPRDLGNPLLSLTGKDGFNYGQLRYGMLITPDNSLAQPFYGNMLRGYHDQLVQDYYTAVAVTALDLRYRYHALFGLPQMGFREAYDARENPDEKERLEFAATLWSYNRGLFTGIDLAGCKPGMDPIRDCRLDGYGGHSTNIQEACNFLNKALDENSIYDFEFNSEDVAWFVSKLQSTYPFQEVPGLQNPIDWNQIKTESTHAYENLLSKYRVQKANLSLNSLSFRYHWRSVLAVIRAHLPEPENALGPTTRDMIRFYGDVLSRDSKLVTW